VVGQPKSAKRHYFCGRINAFRCAEYGRTR
jgi:hypothetical protein